MLALTDSPLLIAKTFEAIKIPTSTRGTVVRSLGLCLLVFENQNFQNGIL